MPNNQSISNAIAEIIKTIDEYNYGLAKQYLKELHAMFIRHELTGEEENLT